MTRQELLKIRAMIEKGATSLDDSDALEVPELFPPWEVGKAYEVGDRMRYAGQLYGQLYKVVQAHTSQDDWTPDATPALYTPVSEPGEIPVWKQPTGAQDAYNTGDKVHYPDADSPIYESLIDNNVWSPEAYPQGWELVEGNVVVPDTPDIVVEDVENVINLEDIGNETPDEPEVKTTRKRRTTVKETNDETT